MRRVPGEILLDNDVVQRICGTSPFSALPWPGYITRELEFIVTLIRVGDAVPFSLAFTDTEGVAGGTLDSIGARDT